LSPEERRHALRLWEFHRLPMEPGRADFVLAMGSHDERVARHAAELVLEGRAPLLVTSGGLGKVTSDTWQGSEGERFAKIAESMGVPSERILVEGEATNTGDNIVLTRRLLEERGIAVRAGILVTKPYMARRAYAAAAKQWPEVTWSVSTPAISFDAYPTDEVPLDKMVNLMVGDLQRLRVYAAQGFQIPQDIPADVWASYEYLRDAGHDRFVIRQERADAP
jgi:uncharacterized SAM-binding protein YcdF (DUF218 family)